MKVMLVILALAAIPACKKSECVDKISACPKDALVIQHTFRLDNDSLASLHPSPHTQPWRFKKEFNVLVLDYKHRPVVKKVWVHLPPPEVFGLMADNLGSSCWAFEVNLRTHETTEAVQVTDETCDESMAFSRPSLETFMQKLELCLF